MNLYFRLKLKRVFVYVQQVNNVQQVNLTIYDLFTKEFSCKMAKNIFIVFKNYSIVNIVTKISKILANNTFCVIWFFSFSMGLVIGVVASLGGFSWC